MMAAVNMSCDNANLDRLTLMVCSSGRGHTDRCRADLVIGESHHSYLGSRMDCTPEQEST